MCVTVLNIFLVIGCCLCFIDTLEKATELEFKVNAVHNQTYLTISCEHPSARLSKTGIFIQGQNTDILAECRWSGTLTSCSFGAKVLPNGVQLTTKYNSSMKLQCGMGDLLVDVKVRDLIISQTDKIQFKATGVHNQTHVIVICDHRFLKSSKSTVVLTEENNLLAECIADGRKHICTPGAKILPTGVQFIIKYNSSMKLKCGTDELLVDVVITKQSPSSSHNGVRIGQGLLLNACKFILTLVLTLSFIHGGLFNF